MIYEILEEVRTAAGTNEKIRILKLHASNDLLCKILRAGHDPYTPFHVVKLPRVQEQRRRRRALANDDMQWQDFLDSALRCHLRQVTGNAAIDTMMRVLEGACSENEKWMRRVLKKHMSLGASTKTINKAIPGLIPTFDVQLAQKFEEKRLARMNLIAVEPKLDGIRCLAVVQDGRASLYARSGKLIINFDDTIGADLMRMGNGVYDGEIMGTDFIALMRQAYRKDDVDVSDTHIALFDYLPLSEWVSREGILGSHERFQELCIRVAAMDPELKYVAVVNRRYVRPDLKQIHDLHAEFVGMGYEGAMIKDANAPYKFGRGPEVMKLKSFFDADLKIEGYVEGTGKNSGKLGSVIVTYEGVQVQVGSGFSDELREQMWTDQDTFLGRVIEVRYQEVTPDGSLRFPTFKCFRNDR